MIAAAKYERVGEGSFIRKECSLNREVRWADYQRQAEGIAASFHTFHEIPLKVWVPSMLVPLKLTQKERERGYIGYFLTQDEQKAMGVIYMDVCGCTFLQYAEFLREEETVNLLGGITINGLNFLLYESPQEDTRTLALPTQNGYLLEFSFAPASDPGFAPMIDLITASIQPARQGKEVWHC